MKKEKENPMARLNLLEKDLEIKTWKSLESIVDLQEYIDKSLNVKMTSKKKIKDLNEAIKFYNKIAKEQIFKLL